MRAGTGTRLGRSVALLLCLCEPYASGTAAAALQVCTDYKINCPEAASAFPTAASLSQPGVVYADNVPNTLDLAQWAADYTRGFTSLLLPSDPINSIHNIWVPEGSWAFGIQTVYHKATDPYQLSGGDPDYNCRQTGPEPAVLGGPQPVGNAPCIEGRYAAQWSVGLSSLFRAREMSGWDRDDANGTLTKALYSFRGTLGEDQFFYAAGSPPYWYYSLMMLCDLYRQFPNNAQIKYLAEQYIAWAKSDMKSLTNWDGRILYYWYNRHADDMTEGNGGYYNVHMVQVEMQAYGAAPLFEWYLLTGNADAFDLGSKANDFVRNYRDPVDGLTPWDNPDSSRFTDSLPWTTENGQFAGHTLAYIPAAVAFTAEARARLKTNPQDAIAREDVIRARGIYEFMKRRYTMGGVLGHFGNASPFGVMLQVGVDLGQLWGAFPDLGMPDTTYWEDVERWTRNAAAEMRIDGAMAQQYIQDVSPSLTGDPRFQMIGTRAVGTFLSDGSHPFQQPFFDFQDDNDGLWLQRGLYDVWAHAIEIKNNAAFVNILMNRAHPYMDVYSDMPWRGSVRTRMHADIGPVKALIVRVPSWVDRNQLKVNEDGAALAYGSQWTWIGGYVGILSVKPGSTYELRFPMAVVQRNFEQVIPQSSWWHESSYGSSSSPELTTPIQYAGTLVGDTLAVVNQRPDCYIATGSDGCIPRYQRWSLYSQIAGSTFNEVDPGLSGVTRFVPNGGGTAATGVDVGLRAFDGSQQLKIAAEPAGTLTSILRLRGADGQIHGILLVDPSDQNASKLRISTPQGTKALRKL